MIASMTMTEPDFSAIPAPNAPAHGGAHSAEPAVAETPTIQPQQSVPSFQTNDSAIVVEAKPIVPHNVVFGGIPYKVLPVKKLGIMAFGKRLEAAGSDMDKILEELTAITNSLFGREVGPKVMARMTDPADSVDIEHIMDLIKKLVERTTGNPTSSSSAS
jgi:hypothetical protein